MSERARIEAVVSTIWQGVLEVGTVSAEDNFLDFGGNSLKAGELVWLIRDELHVDLPIDVVLDTQTFKELVDAVVTAADGRSISIT